MAEGNHNDAADVSSIRRLVLCLDGTGNKFSGNSSDTNIVKLYQMLDRKTPEQFHYYQPGIGTYAPNQSGSSSGGFFAKFKSNVSAALDQAVGTSFEAHVVAGYQFIMRYFSPGDAIYIFGFSRGAYTARFLAEMVQTIGLLSQGNEEMVHFAYNAFSLFQQARGRDPLTDKDKANIEFMTHFKETFCRPDVVIHFLGLFDCVNSVGQFEIPLFRKSYRYIAMPAATHIRHAVSIHERRLKFKPALFVEEQLQGKSDVKEVWFAGNHGDVGGGWAKPPDQHRQLSDIPLAWMVQELLDLPERTPKDTPSGGKTPASQSDQDKRPSSNLKFRTVVVGQIERKELTLERSLKQSPLSNHQKRRLYMSPHDMLRFGGGASWFGVFCWWIIESLPFFTRLELEKGEWVPRYWPPNMGSSRDIPEGAVIHQTVEGMRRAGVLRAEQMPKFGGDGPQQAPFNPARIIAQWESVRKSRAASKSAGKKPNSDVDNSDTTHLLSAARKWESSGHVGAKRWTLD